MRLRSFVLPFAVPFFVASSLFSPSAFAEVEFRQLARLYDDVDGSGGPSCGDLVFIGGAVGSQPPNMDLTNVEITLTYPSHVTLEPQTFVAGDPLTDCQIVEGDQGGDLRIRIVCPFICSSNGAKCASNGISFGSRVTIDDPNPFPSFSLQAEMTADQIEGTLIATDVTGPFEYEPCPDGTVPLPPILAARMTDSLVADVDGDGLVDEGDTVRYTVGVLTTSGGNAADVVFEAPPPEHTTLVVGSVASTSPGITVLSGNSAGDAVVRVDVGTAIQNMPKWLTYDVVVGSVPAPITALSSQGVVSASNTTSRLSDDPDTPAPSDPTETPLDFDPDLALSKAPRTASATAGSTAVFDLAWSNPSRSLATGVVLTETVPLHAAFDAGASTPGWSCADGAPAGATCTLALGTVPAGASGTATFAVRIDPTLPAAVSSTANRASVRDDGSAGPDRNPANNDAEATIALDAAPDLYVVKTGPAAAAPGPVLYELTYGNTGTQDATAVELVEQVPAHTTFDATASPDWSCPDGAPAGTACVHTVGGLAAGAIGHTIFAVQLLPSAPHDEDLVNTAAVTDDGDNGNDLDPSDNLDTAVTDVLGPPDLHVAKTGPSEVAAGAIVAYDLAFGNRGEQPATGVVLRETVPAPATFDAAASSPGWSCTEGAPAGTACTLAVPDLPPGDTGTATFAVRLSPAAPPGDDLINRVTISDDGAHGPDADPTDNTDTAVTDVLGPPDLHVAKTGPAQAAAGTLVVYDLAHGNRGEQPATGVVLRETVPAPATFDAAASSPGWSCTEGAPAGTACTLAAPDLPPGGAGAATFAVRLPAAIPAGVEAMTNHVEIDDDASHGADPTPADNTASATTAIAAAPDLMIDKMDGDLVAERGVPITYTLSLANTGDQDATDVLVVDLLPAGLLVDLDGSTTGWSCSPPEEGAPPACSYLLPALAAGAHQTLALRVEPLPSLPLEVTEIVNVATVEDDGAGGPDPDPSDNRDEETTPLRPPTAGPPDLAATLTDQVLEGAASPGVAAAGSVVSYTAVVTNQGAGDATDVAILLPPDAHTTLRPASVTTTAGTTTFTSAGALQVDVPVLAAGDTVAVTFEVDVDDELPPMLDRLAVHGDLTAANAPPTTTDDPDTPAPLDPTETPLAAGDPPPAAEDIPTASTVGLAALALLLLAAAGRRLRPAAARSRP